MSRFKTNQRVYAISKKVYNRALSKNSGAEILNKEIGFPKGSAKIIFNQVFPSLIEGRRFTRTLKASDFEDFIGFIYSDFGIQGFKRALFALEKHILYMISTGAPSITLKKIYNAQRDLLLKELPESAIDNFEQEEITDFLNEKEISREELIKMLEAINHNSSEKVEINHKAYKRNNKSIALIKKLRGFKCQICEKSIQKKNGDYYVEAAHINPKKNNSSESQSNIILLCPNHHKEFDLGNTKVLNKTPEHIEFSMNGSKYKITLKIK